MIIYSRAAYGLNIVFRVSGSAIYRSLIPATLSLAFFLILRLVVNDGVPGEGMSLEHPYAVGVIVSGTTFLIVFRASQGYSRYWEATTASYTMMSKWMDACCHTACYHMQSEHYDKIKPPSYHDHPGLNTLFLTRARERVRKLTESGLHAEGVSESIRAQRARSVGRSINVVQTKSRPNLYHTKERFVSVFSSKDFVLEDTQHPSPLLGDDRVDGNWGNLFGDGTATYHDAADPDGSKSDPRGFSSTRGGRTASLFLQELAHLTSLLSAVALSTLRNDIDGAESPLDLYEPGAPWPNVDPGLDIWKFDGTIESVFKLFYYFLGYGRSPEERTRMNASRPLPVLGGVSDSEIRFLQMARGPYAKTQLCWSWLSEFIVREHLAGSLGQIGSPIISRVVQFMSDGMKEYNAARKIMFVPFPFVHAQLSAVFILSMIFLIPYLMHQYIEATWIGSFMTLLAVSCLTSIHESAREMENPFRNVPNDLPVITWQAEFNEALITTYAGFHPDAFWADKFHKMRSESNHNLSSQSIDPGTESSTEKVAEFAEDDRPSTPEPGTTGTEVSPDKNHAVSPMPGDETGTLLQPPNADHVVSPRHSSHHDTELMQQVLKSQGEIISKLLEEQARTNKLLESLLVKK